MSVLETFVILFKGDATSLDKTNRAVKKSLDDVNESFKRVAKQAGAAILAFVSVRTVLNGMRSALDFSDSLGKLAEGLGESTERLSVYGDAVKLSGGTVEGFQTTVKSLTASLADFATKGRSRTAPFFQELGIKMVDSQGKARKFLDLLPELADAFQKISKSESFGIGQKLGLDEGTIRLLQKGRKEIEILIAKQKELGVVTKRDAEIAAKFKDRLDNIKHSFRTLFTGLNGEILPILEKLGERLEKVIVYLNKHPDLLAGALLGVAVAAGVLAAVFAGPFLIVSTIIGGLIALFALLYEDIKVFSEGGDSFIGQLLDKFPTLKAFLIGTINLFKGLGGAILAVGSYLTEIWNNPLKLWEDFKNSIAAGIDWLASLFPKVTEKVNQLGEKFGSIGKLISAVWQGIIDTIKQAVSSINRAIDTVAAGYNKVKSFFGVGSSDKSANPVAAATQSVALANRSQLPASNVSSILHNRNSLTRNTSVDVGDIYIQTQATDSQGISNDIGRSLDAQLRQALNNADDGVAA